MTAPLLRQQPGWHPARWAAPWLRKRLGRSLHRGARPEHGASAAASCLLELRDPQVCGSLAKLLWGGLTSWVNLHQRVPSKKRIAAYAAELCEYEVRRCATLCHAAPAAPRRALM